MDKPKEIVKTVNTNTTGDLKMTLTSETYEGRILDTKVEIQDGTLCWISGMERESFIDDFNELIGRYRI